ncbi:hypothetical protein TrRE_jg3006 [Triparma retinervis]|uniref:Uncharacterized protein n=1 Tax=Triparma retinervis TaxID=2557542 RepID=A0A9W6ZPF9_9STRA|nr:hypothetical protein TrRE_jg3006 [Triparma retinervis]
MSTALSPPLVLFFKYFDNVLKTPPTLEYKNRRTINTKNKTFVNTITAFEKLSKVTFPVPLHLDNRPLASASTRSISCDGKSTTEAELRALQGRQRAMRGGAKEGTITELQVTTAELYNAKMKADAERAKAEEAEMEMEAEKEQTKVPGDGMLLSQTLKRNLESQARR